MAIYVNGVRVDTASNVAQLLASNRIGSSLGQAFFDGLIDDAKIYPYALTADDVKIDYDSGYSAVVGSSGTNATTGAPTNASSGKYCVPGDTTACAPPVGEWKMDEKVSGDAKTIYDTSGNGNNGTTHYGANTTGMDCSVSGKAGSACSFDGVDDYVSVTNNSSIDAGAGGWSVGAWVKYSLLARTRVVSKRTGLSTPFAGYELAIEDTGQILFTVDDNVSSYKQVLSTSAYNDNNWHYVLGVADRSTSTIKVYVDGKDVSSSVVSIAGYGSFSTSSDLLIGRITITPSQYFNGQIDQVRIYNYARTPSQIAWEYNKGKPVAEWRMNECQGTTIHDESGKGNNGTLSLGASGQTTAGTCTANANTPWYNGRTGKYGASLNFDGVDDYVDAGNSSLLQLTNNFSASFWVKRTGTWGRIMSKWDLANSKGWGVFFNNTQIDIAFRKSYTDYWSGTGADVVPNNTWAHVAFTYPGDGSSPRLWVNGKEQSLTIGYDVGDALHGITDSGENISIGRCNAFNFSFFYFPGQIDNVKIFNYALTPTQIQQLYNNSSALNFGN